MVSWNALSDDEVKFDLNMIIVAQNAKKRGFDLLRVEISKIRMHHRKRLDKVVGVGFIPLVIIHTKRDGPNTGEMFSWIYCLT